MRTETEKKGSLTRELAVIIIGLVAGTIILCWFINTSFLGKYYMLHKQDTLLDGFQVIDEASAHGELTSDNFDVTFDNLCANGNITVMIISSDRTIIRSSVNDNQAILIEFMNVLFGNNDSKPEILKKADNYVIQRKTDTRLQSEYLVLYGTLSNGNLILMRTALESIRESAAISSRFLLYVGMIAIVLSAVVTAFVSKGIMTPILELTDISKRMTELDFDAKYSGRKRRYKNEIDELGEHINRLSTALETTISELKSANNELKQDIQKKTEIDEMRKDFLSNVSHELKTPLTSISGFAELMMSGGTPDDTVVDFSKSIYDEAQRLITLVNDIIKISRLDDGSVEYERENIDLYELSEEIARRIKPVSDKAGLKVSVTGEHAVFFGVRKILDEMIFNLCDNAVKYNRQNGTVDINIRKENGRTLLSVKDSGFGIPVSAQDRVFERFYRVDSSRSKALGGTGLGLSIVKHGAIYHGADIKLESEENVGTTITVSFPEQDV